MCGGMQSSIAVIVFAYWNSDAISVGMNAGNAGYSGWMVIFSGRGKEEGRVFGVARMATPNRGTVLMTIKLHLLLPVVLGRGAAAASQI